MSQYRLKVVSKITSVPLDTIRNWEKRYDFLKPQINSQGEKIYSDRDIELLKKVTTLLRSGGRISEIASRVLTSDSVDDLVPDNMKMSTEVKLVIEDYYKFLLDVDLKQIDQIESLIEITVLFKNRVEFIYCPLLERARQDCLKGLIRPSQERFVTNHLSHKLKAFLSASIYVHDPYKCGVICAVFSTKSTEDGALSVGCGMKLRGHNIFYIGSAMPVEELHYFAEKVQPAVLTIGLYNHEELEYVIKHFEKAPYPVCVGGIGARVDEKAGTQIGSVHIINYAGILAVEKIEPICLEYSERLRKTK